MYILSIANQKGGVGKTTTSVEFAYCLSNLGFKVLLIDFDQQANLTTYLNIKNDNTISKVMNGDIEVNQAIVHLDGIDAIASSEELSKADKTYTEINDVYLLEDICKILNDNNYDFIIIDNSPSRNILLTMSYIASDFVIVPTECDKGSVNGILAIERDISVLRDGRHKSSNAMIGLILLNKYEKTIMHEVAYEEILDLAKDIAFKPDVVKIRKSIKASESKQMEQSIQQYAKYNTVAIDYRNAVKTLLNKLGVGYE